MFHLWNRPPSLSSKISISLASSTFKPIVSPTFFFMMSMVNSGSLSLSSGRTTGFETIVGHCSQASAPSANSSSVRRIPPRISRIAVSSMALPMKTSSCRRVPDFAGAPHDSQGNAARRVVMKPAWLHSTAHQVSLAIHAYPLERSRPGNAPLAELSACSKRSGWNGRSMRYTKLEIPYSSVSGLCLTPFNSAFQPGIMLADSRSNVFVFKMHLGSTTPN
mmetsp:Transcript_19488/g.53542  ORF Transcript_19488/g.53542 Transcript_19488/m.53542 type:complete len:220 (-) Transcript_19488:348-1007(-)